MKTYYRSTVALLSMMAVLSFGACADDDIVNERKDVKDGLGFSVSDIQDATEDQTRAIATHPEDYAVRQLDFAEAAGNACLQETTVPGVNPVKRDAATRSDFQNSIGAPFGAFACKNGSGKPDFFYNEKVNANGNMVSPKAWTSDEASLQFYAVYPFVESSNPNVKLTQTVAGELPCIDFTTPTDIANQIDLMTASTQNINHTNTGGGAHVVPLTFYHSLTAIRFGVGSNLSWGKTIKSVEFQGVYSKGRYDMKTKTWSGQNTTQNYKLDNIGVSTSEAVNNVILKDGNTFLMVPQTLPAGAKIVVTFSDNTSVTAKIEGKKWKPGTTKTYMITEKNSNWEYFIQASDPTAAAYDATQTGNYSISSYRQAPDGTQRPVAWKVKEYSFDNGATWVKTIPANSWLTGLSLMQGNGSTAAQQGTATLTKDVTDLLAECNAKLKLNPKGSIGTPYDLSMHDVKGNLRPSRSTANCYIISHPGYYKIPLVYGNAITNGATNTNAYQTGNTGTYILTHFKDHNNADITDPWIEKTNGGANNGVNDAKIVWADEANLVHFGSNPIVRNGNETFVQFDVPASAIQSGNAVIAVMRYGTVVWSWHLWFAPQDALDKIPVTNHQGFVYNFTKESLGWKPTQWKNTTYTSARTVKVKVEQTVGNNGTKKEAVINITQNPFSVKKGATTLYQFGRKDAFPGVATADIKQGSITENAGDNMSIQNGIQNPGSFYTAGNSWWSTPPASDSYYNLWSADNTVTRFNDNSVVKTVYDPCPVGFKMPASNAFTRFTTNGKNGGPMNVDGTNNSQTYYNNFGHNFWTSSSKTATINFPASGYRGGGNGSLGGVGYFGHYWSAVPYNTGDGCLLYLSSGFVFPLYNYTRSAGFAVRPVADE